MKLTSINYTNIKGTDGHFPLKSVNMITGPNGAGKSALISGVKLWLWGFDLEFGKQHKSTILLSAESRPSMSVAMTLDPDIAGERTWLKKADGDVKYKETGTFVGELPPILMDMDEFLSPKKTEQDRIAYVFKRTADTDLGYSDEALLEELGKLEAVPIQPALKSRESLIKFVKESIEKRKRNKMKIQDWIEELLADIKERKKDADNSHKLTGQSVSTLRPNGPPPVDRTAEISAREKEVSALNKEISALESEQSVFNQQKKRLAEIDAKLALPVADNSELVAEHDRLKAATDAYKSKTKALGEKIAAKRAEAKQIRQQANAANAEATKLENHIREHSCTDPDCPMRRLVEAEIKKHTTQASQFNEKYDGLVAEGKKLTDELSESEKTDKENSFKLARAAEIRQTINSANSITEALRAELEKERPALLSASFDEQKFNAAKSKREDLEKTLAELRAQQNAFIQAKTNREQLNTFEQRLLEHQAESAICDLAIKEIAKLQQQILERAFAPLLEKSKPFTDGLLLKALNGLEYRKQSLGLMSPLGWVPLKLFNTSDRSLAYAGISVALAQASPFKVVFIDQMENFESGRKAAVLKRMCDLVRGGVIHAFFGTDNRTDDYLKFKDPEFNHIILG